MKPVSPDIEHLQIARTTLLTPYGLDETDLSGVLGSMFSNRIDYADLYFQYTRSEGWSLEEGIVKSGSFNIEQGVGVRAISGEKTAFAYSDDISLSALKDAAAATAAIGRQGNSRSVKAGSGAARRLYGRADPLVSLEAQSKVGLLERIEKMARGLDTRVVQVMASLGGTYEVVLVARSDGVLAADVRPLVRLSITVIAEAGGRRETGSSGGGGRFDYGYFSDDILLEYAKQAVHAAITHQVMAVILWVLIIRARHLAHAPAGSTIRGQV